MYLVPEGVEEGSRKSILPQAFLLIDRHDGILHLVALNGFQTSSPIRH